MKNRRIATQRVAPAYEDGGLFKKPLVKIEVELVPDVQRNLRQDLMVRGFAGSSQEILVVFAGRRIKQSGALMRTLMRLGSHSMTQATSQGAGWEAEGELPRLKVLIEGDWRIRFQRDQTGWESKYYQLMAARWSVAERGAYTAFAGALPITEG